jgi:hypothetical protein
VGRQIVLWLSLLLTEGRPPRSLTPPVLETKLSPPVRPASFDSLGGFRHAVSPVPNGEPTPGKVLSGVRVVSRSFLPNLWKPAMRFCLERAEGEL